MICTPAKQEVPMGMLLALSKCLPSVGGTQRVPDRSAGRKFAVQERPFQCCIINDRLLSDAELLRLAHFSISLRSDGRRCCVLLLMAGCNHSSNGGHNGYPLCSLRFTAEVRFSGGAFSLPSRRSRVVHDPEWSRFLICRGWIGERDVCLKPWITNDGWAGALEHDPDPTRFLILKGWVGGRNIWSWTDDRGRAFTGWDSAVARMCWGVLSPAMGPGA